MKPIAWAGALALTVCLIGAADAQVFREARENAAGGVTAGARADVIGSNGRAVGERGLVTDGDGSGAAGGRGCARAWSGAAGCRSGATTWNEDGRVDHESSAYAAGWRGNSFATEGGFTRAEDGDLNGSRSTEATIGGRTYSAETSFDEDGFDREVICTNTSGQRVDCR